MVILPSQGLKGALIRRGITNNTTYSSHPQIKSAHSGYQDRDYEFPAEKNKNVIGWTKLTEFFLRKLMGTIG